MVEMIWKSGCHSPALRASATPASGMNRPSIGDVVGAGAAHAERVPGVEHLHLGRLHGHAEMQHLGRLAVEDRAGHQDVAGFRAGGEDLARGDAVAALDLFRLARSGDPVRAAAGQQHDLLGRDALQQRLDGRDLLVAPAPGREWRPGACAWKRRAPVEPQACAMIRIMSQSSAISAPRAAEFDRNAGLDKAGFLERLVVVGDETIVVVGR